MPDMRITYAAPANLASGEAHCVHIMNMCHALAAEGAEVLAVVDDAPVGDDLFRRFAVQPFALRRARSRGRRLASLRFAADALRATRKQDVLFTRNLPAALLGVLSGRRTILELHSPPETARARRMLQWVLNSPHCMALVVITHALKDRIGAQLDGGASDKILVLPDAAPEPRPLADAAPLELQHPAIGYVGSFHPGKGVELIVQVAARMPDHHFYVVGGTPAEIGRVRRDVQAANLHFLGRISYADVAGHVSALDVALLPNQPTVLVSNGSVDIGAWTSPLKLFEYMACGKAIVASRLPVLSEVLQDGRDCLMADAADAGEWVAQIARLSADAHLRERLGTAARAAFLARYSWRSRASRVIDLIRGSLRTPNK